MMQLHQGHAVAREFFTPANASTYEAVARYATFGQDARWKRRIVELLAGRHSVLELACGTGVLSSMLQRAGMSVVGLDLTFEYLAQGAGRSSAGVAQGTAEMLPFRGGQFEAVASSYLAKYADIDSVIRESFRVLRTGGRAVFHDFTFPQHKAARLLWRAHFALLRTAGLAVPSWSKVFGRLDSFIEASRWEARTEEGLRKMGFVNIETERMTAGTAAIIVADKP